MTDFYFRTTSLILSLCFLIPSPALAETDGRWTEKDTILQSAFILFTVIGWRQTREFSRNRAEYPERYETTPFLRGHPSARDANIAAAAAIVIHGGIAYALPDPYRNIWQGFWVGVQGEAVLCNFVAGISVSF